MNKITDMIISALIKRGIVYEARNVVIRVNLPVRISDKDDDLNLNTATIEIDHMTLRVDKEDSIGKA